MPAPHPDDLSSSSQAARPDGTAQPPTERVAPTPGSTLGPPALQPSQLSVPDWLWVFRCDQRRRWQSGERILAEAYLAQQPILKTQPFALLDLIEEEVSLREELGELPRQDEYLKRFPDFAAPIQRLFALRRALKSGTLPVPPITTGPEDATLVPPEEQADAWAAAARSAATRQALPGYEIHEELGRGGMGVVYKARQLGLNRAVALKMILGGVHAGKAERDRFHREAEAVAKLQHPYIVQVYEVGQHQGRPYFSLELVEGGSLAQQLLGNPLPVRRAAELMEKLARAMHYAHQRGIVHRDLKPANVLLTLEGEPKITDFGLAKHLGSTAGQTQSGAILGTPSYMAPEQAWGKNQWVGPPADVYALGALLYEMLVGRPPFKAESALDTISQVVNDEPLPLTRLQPKVPTDLETICLKCLRKDPGRRYPSADAFADDLRRFLNSEPVLARPIGKVERFRRWCRRNPALATASGLAALALVAITIISVSFAVQEANSARMLEAALKDAKEKSEALAEKTEREEKRKQEWVPAALEDALALCEQGDTARGLVWLTKTLDMITPETKGLEETIRTNLAGWSRQVNTLQAILPHESSVSALAVRPDGGALFTAGADGKLLRWETGARTSRDLSLPDKVGVLALAVSPDGQNLLLGCKDGTARLLDLKSGKPSGPILKHAEPVLAVAFSPDGQKILTGSGDGKARLWDRTAGRALQTVQHQAEVTAVAFNPNGRAFATASLDKTARRWDAATGQPIGSPLEHPDAVLAVAFSPDGRNLVTGCKDHSARLWEAATGKIFLYRFPHQGAVAAVAYSPDGRTILTGSADKTARLWEEATGQALGSPLSHRAEVQAVAFGPDGRALFTGGADATARLWERASGRGVQPPLIHPAPIEAVAFSPDGLKVLTGGQDYTARLWNRLSGTQIGPALVHKSHVYVVGFSPDGKLLATGGGDKLILLWNATTLQPVGRPLQHKEIVWAVAFTSDSKFVLTASGDKTAQLWETATGKAEGPPFHHPDEIIAAAISPNGAVVALGGVDKTVALWNVATRKAWGKSLPHPNSVWSLAFSPDGNMLLTGCADNNARLWEVPSGKQRGTFAHLDKVRSVAFSPNGKTFLTGSVDRTAHLWEVASGKHIGQSFRHKAKVNGVAFSPDGTLLLTASADGTARIWEAARPLRGQSEQLILWAQASTGLELDAARMEQVLASRRREPGSAIRVLSEASWRSRHQRWQAEGGPRNQAPLLDSPLAWHRREAANCEVAGQDHAARSHLDRLLQEDPANGALHARRANANARLGQWQQVLDDCQNALRHQQEGNWEVWYRLGQAYSKQNQDKLALGNYSKAIQLAPENGALWLSRSLAAFRLGLMEKMEEDYVQAALRSQGVQLREDRLWWDRDRGLPIWRQTAWDALLSDLSTLPSTPADWNSWRARGLVQAARGEWAAAAADFEQAGRLHPPDWHSPWGSARAHAELSQAPKATAADKATASAKALAACTLALQKQGKEWNLWFLRACLHYNASRYQEAILDLHEALALHPKGCGLWGTRAAALEQLSEYSAAIPDYSKALEERGDYAWLWAHRGYVYYQNKQDRKAIEDLNQALELDAASFSWAFNFRGLCHQREGDWELARADFQEAFRRNPKYDAPAANLADGYFARGDYARAVDAYTQAISANSRVARYFKDRARALDRLGQWDRAVADFDRALNISASPGGMWLQKYRSQVRAGQGTRADEAFDRALAQSQGVYLPGDRRWADRLRGVVSAERFSWEEALTDINRDLGQNTNAAWLHRARGAAQAALARWQEAAAAFDKAAALDSRDWQSLYGAARACAEQGQWPLASALCLKALALKDDSWDLWYFHGILSFQQVAYPEAAADFDRSTQRNPRVWAVWTALAETQEKMEKGDPAIASYSHALDLTRDQAWIFYQRANLYQRQGKNDLALADFSQAIQVNGRYAGAYNGRGLIYLTQNKLDLALADFDKAVLYEPSFADAWDNRGFTYYRKGPLEYAKALSDFNKALQLNPRHYWAHVDRGLLHAAQNQFDKAIDDYTRAIEINATIAAAFRNRGYAHSQRGRWDKAIADYEKSLALKPDELVCWTSLVTLYLQVENPAGYRKTCQGMFKVFGKTREPVVASSMIWFCVLTPDCGVPPAQLLELGQNTLAATPNNYNYAGTLGAAQFRAGKYKEAAESTNKSITLHGKGGLALDWLFLAMTYHKLEKKEEAQKWLEKAQKWIEENVEHPPKDKPTWNNLLQWRLLRKEAEGLIKREQKTKA